MSRGTRKAVQQMVPSLSPRDAVGNHTLRTQQELALAGYPGDIWVESVHLDLQTQSRPVSDFPKSRSGRRQRDLLLYQASTGSDEMVPAMLSRKEPKLIYYHNITPPEFFEPWDEHVVETLVEGRDELKMLADHVGIAMAASEYNARELRALGMTDVRVVPPFLSNGINTKPNRALGEWLRRTKRGLDVIFVGRVMPNKGHQHLLRAFAALRATVDPGARLFVVGSWGPRSYMQWLWEIRERIGTERVVFTGSISDSHLAAVYESADAFLCLSEHEGFGIPLIEAMRHGLPVVAFDAGAVAETLNGAGALVRTLDPSVVAEVVAKVATDESLRSAMIDRQHERVRALEKAPRREVLLGAVRDALGE